MKTRRSRLFPFVVPLVALLAVIVLASAAPLGADPPPAPEPAAGEAVAVLPPGVKPLPAEQERRLGELLRAAERIRGLKAGHPVPSGIVEEEDLPGKIAESLREELPPERLRAAEVGLKAFGLLPESLDLARYYPELLASQVAGYYDPERRYLTVVHHGGSLLGKEADAALGGEARKIEEMILVHELTHALQDQAFDLHRFIEDDPLSDEVAARTALVEGDATLVMFDFFAGVPLESTPGAAKALVAAGSARGGRGDGGASDLPGAKEMAAAPPWLRETLEFGYLEGYLFCLSVREKGGQKLLDYAFTQDPPRSSEQILHPEKWHTRRDDPIPLPWPDLGRELPGARKLAEGTLGELGIAILLREAAHGGESAADAADAAAGWGGDRFAVYDQAGRRLLAWITEWDSATDARELQTAARRLGRGWSVERVAPRRVVILHGPWKRKEARALRAALAAVQAGRPGVTPYRR
jgi:hypothetical protein